MHEDGIIVDNMTGGALVGRGQSVNIIDVRVSGGFIETKGGDIGGLAEILAATATSPLPLPALLVKGSSQLGGLIGTHTGDISRSYTTGKWIRGGGAVGDLVGDSRGTIINSYYDVRSALREVGNMIDSPGGITGYTKLS